MISNDLKRHQITSNINIFFFKVGNHTCTFIWCCRLDTGIGYIIFSRRRARKSRGDYLHIITKVSFQSFISSLFSIIIIRCFPIWRDDVETFSSFSSSVVICLVHHLISFENRKRCQMAKNGLFHSIFWWNSRWNWSRVLSKTRIIIVVENLKKSLIFEFSRHFGTLFTFGLPCLAH